MTCAIHQPNFFPWLGYFDKMRKSDIFIILDDVQVQKKGSGYWNRASININGESKFITAPMQRKSGFNTFRETSYQDTKWRETIIKTLQANYSKSKNFQKYRDVIFDLIRFESNNMFEYNFNSILKLKEMLGIDTEMVLSSDLGVNTKKEDRVIELCMKVNATEYLSGTGAKEYQKEENFLKKGITLTYQEFEHPVYTQRNTKSFLSGLSVIDYLFEGKE